MKGLREEETRLIHRFEERTVVLEGEYREKVRQVEAREKELWKKELELRRLTLLKLQR